MFDSLVELAQGCGACLDQMTTNASINWHRPNVGYYDDDFEVRLLNKVVQLCYVSEQNVSTEYWCCALNSF